MPGTIRNSASLPALLALGLLAFNVGAQAEESKPADPPFKLGCKSQSAKFLPKGNAAVGTAEFDVEVDPAARQAVISGKKARQMGMDKFEVWIHADGGAAVSISRTNFSFRMISDLGSHGGDSRLYVLHEGKCKPI